MDVDFPSSCIPFTSDPALHDDWDLPNGYVNKNAPTNEGSNSDDIEALHLLQQETTATKNYQDCVIQHRAWKVEEVFRSDIDHQHISPLRTRSRHIESLQTPTSPLPALGEMSSPPRYPSSSPPSVAAKRPASPLKPKQKRFGALIEDASDDDDLFAQQPPTKRVASTATKAAASKFSVLEPINANVVAQPTPEPSQKSQPKRHGAFLIDSDSEDDTPQIIQDEVFRPAVQQEPIARPSFLDWDYHKTASQVDAQLSFFNSSRKEIKKCDGKTIRVPIRKKTASITYMSLIAARSTVKAGRAQKSYYGIDIHALKDSAMKTIKADAAAKEKAAVQEAELEMIDEPLPSVEAAPKKKRTQMWTEKYRARRFFDLCGDDRTHRDVLRWLKAWDSIVFPSSTSKPKSNRPALEAEEEPQHRKILLLTGPPGLGKTTLAHVIATQAGYEVAEINASDDRSANVVKDQIRTVVGTESVKTVSGSNASSGKTKGVRPVCVVVDEVDGVTTGGGPSGEGGFIKALIDLIALDAKNSASAATQSSSTFASKRKSKKADESFRLLRPIILIANDAYAASLRPLRQSGCAEVIRIRAPPLESVVGRLKSVFSKEGIAADADAVRRLVESVWGIQPIGGIGGGDGRGGGGNEKEGDLRSVLVVGEWVARKLRVEHKSKGLTGHPKLTRKWLESHLAAALGADDGERGGAGGGSKEVVRRVFTTGAGFPVQAPSSLPSSVAAKSSTHIDTSTSSLPKTKLHASEVAKKHGMSKLRDLVDTSDEHDRVVADIFATFPTVPFNDDTVMSKPDRAYEWLHFYTQAAHGVYQEQSWELIPYLSQPILACHDLFCVPARAFNNSQKSGNGGGDRWGKKDEEVVVEEKPYMGLKAEFEAKEARNQNHSILTEFLDSLRDAEHVHRTTDAALLRSLRGPEAMATELLPYLVKILSPDVKPVVVGGGGDNRGVASVRRESEKKMVGRAVDVMASLGVSYQRGKLESSGNGWGQTEWVFRMEP